jgi:5-methylcytosine-specific restriction endonuclease McrA
MNILKVIKYILKSKDHHFISVDYCVWKKWNWLLQIIIRFNKNYVPCVIYRKRYKFLKQIVVIGLKWNGKNVKRRTSGFAKDFLQVHNNAKCPFCKTKLSLENATTDHIIPISEGGNNTQVNLIVTCFDCNNERGATDFYKYLKIKNPEFKTKFI